MINENILINTFQSNCSAHTSSQLLYFFGLKFLLEKGEEKVLQTFFYLNSQNIYPVVELNELSPTITFLNTKQAQLWATAPTMSFSNLSPVTKNKSQNEYSSHRLTTHSKYVRSLPSSEKGMINLIEELQCSILYCFRAKRTKKNLTRGITMIIRPIEFQLNSLELAFQS